MAEEKEESTSETQEKETALGVYGIALESVKLFVVLYAAIIAGIVFGFSELEPLLSIFGAFLLFVVCLVSSAIKV